MKSPSSRYRALLLLSFILTTTYGQVWGAESVNITSLQVTPDLKQISIGCDGPVGKHSAFVAQKPYRLVLDMASTGLGRIPMKINVGRDPINEIRLGYANSRARVVVDFGDHPAPSFRIDRQNNGLLVNLEPRVGAWQPRPVAKPAAQLPKDPVQPKAVVSAPAAPEVHSSKVSVKTAGVKDDLVFVELASKKDPKRTYRVVIDLEVDELQVRQATVSDDQGHLKRFDLASGVTGNDIAGSTIKSNVGPRTNVRPTATPSDGHPKFKWGIQAGENKQRETAKLNTAGPIRLERFEPQRIQHQAAAN